VIVNETIFSKFKYFSIQSKDMKTFINDNFLLNNRIAEKLYHKYAENQPIIDFHCHLSPAMISEDRQFKNLTQAWLEGDHYKWRAMRTNGINETYCTGNASDPEKFAQWAETVPATVGNPLYHWTHLELSRYFNINDLLSPATANKIYENASAQLLTKEFSTKSLIRKMKVETICTTDDPTDSLEHHIKIKGSFEIPVIPTWRPDNIVKTEDPEKLKAYLLKLEQVSGIEIKNFESLIEALDNRHKFFHDNGGRLSDHGLERFYFATYTTSEVDKILKKLLHGETISAEEAEKYKTAAMLELCKINHKRGWTQQFHVGALRNNNARMFRQMGPDTGWDSIGISQDPQKISKFLSALDDTDKLAKTILYNLNPADNEMMIAMAGNFNDGSSAVKVQYGAAWWFLDQKSGMEKHLKDLASLGLLRRFVGMVTDSRSFLSYPRHEYFRRLVCNYVGEEVEKGLIPDEEELLKPLIEGISYRNAKDYFGFGK
jgi:glucuronate isomerase